MSSSATSDRPGKVHKAGEPILLWVDEEDGEKLSKRGQDATKMHSPQLDESIIRSSDDSADYMTNMIASSA